MAYEKHTWECGETVTADKLNHMEDGIAGGGGSEPLIVNAPWIDESSIMDKNFGEIRAAFESGRVVKISQYKSDSNETEYDMADIVRIHYTITESEASGFLGADGSGNYAVTLTQPPYTLEALDEEYPYMSD